MADTTASKTATPAQGAKPADKPADRKPTVGTGEGQIGPGAIQRDPRLAEGADVDTSEAERVASGSKVPLYNIHAGITRRVGGPFLDELELEEAERRRAIVEGRAPDYTNMAGSAGVPLVTAGELAQAHQADTRGLTQFIDENAGNKSKGPTPVTEADAKGNVTQEALDEKEREVKAFLDYDETKVTSHDDPAVVYAAPVENAGK